MASARRWRTGSRSASQKITCEIAEVGAKCEATPRGAPLGRPIRIVQWVAIPLPEHSQRGNAKLIDHVCGHLASDGPERFKIACEGDLALDRAER